MPLPFTAYLGLPVDDDFRTQYAESTCRCDQCDASATVGDGVMRLFPYGEKGAALVAFMACPQCDAPVVTVLIGDQVAHDAIAERLAYEAQPGFDPSALDPLPVTLTRREVAELDDNDALKRVECAVCARSVPVMTVDFIDARHEYTHLPGPAFLFNAPCPWCGKFFYKAIGQPDAVNALYEILEAEQSAHRLH